MDKRCRRNDRLVPHRRTPSTGLNQDTSISKQSVRFTKNSVKLNDVLAELVVPSAITPALNPTTSTTAIYYSFTNIGFNFVDTTKLIVVGNKVVIKSPSINADIRGLLADLHALAPEGGSTSGNMLSGLMPIAPLEATSAIENLNFAHIAQSSQILAASKIQSTPHRTQTKSVPVTSWTLETLPSAS